MLAYCILLFLVIIFNIILKPKKSRKNKIYYLRICFIIFFIISAFRNATVGSDTQQFCNAFLNIKNMDLSVSLEHMRYEKGFIIFCKILSIISNNYQILIICSSLFIYYAVFNFICNNSENPLLSVLIFICLNSFFMYLSAMRQAMAIGILMIAYDKFYKKDKKIKLIISILIAMAFHTSAIVFAILLLIPRKIIYNRKILIITCICAIIAYLFPQNIFDIVTLNSKYSGYRELSFFESSEYAGILNFMICLIELSFAYIFSKKYIKENKEINLYLYILSINLIIYSLSINISIFVRLTTYFEIFNIIYLPYVIDNLSIRENKKIVIPLFIIFMFSYWLIVAKYRPEWYRVIPYKFMS